VNRTFNEANQLVTSTDTELGTSSFTYDDNGNLVEFREPLHPIPSIVYFYNQRNLLVKVEEPVDHAPNRPIADYVYDGDGNRLQQVDYTDTTPVTTTYTNDIIGLSQVLVSDDGTTTTYNLFGLDLISQDDGTQTRFLLTDGLGSTRIEMVGTTIKTATTYEPYGKLLAQTGSSGTTYGYTGEQYDALTSLIYLRARYYNPSLKLFMSRDPFPGYATLSISQNGYAYVHANPVNLTDPSGKIVPLIIGGLIIGAVTGVTWDVMVEQGKGGVENILNGVFFDDCHWADVNWGRAWFKGGLGGVIGSVSAPVIYLVGSYGPSAVSNAPMFAYTRGVSAAYRVGQAAPRAASVLRFIGKAYGAFEFGSDALTVARGIISDDPQAKFDAATALLNLATGATNGVETFVGYHGTSSVHADSIRRRIDPPTGANFDGYAQLGDGFYTTLDYEAAEYFADTAVANFGGNPIIFEVYARNFDQMTGTVVQKQFWNTRNRIRMPQEYIDNYDMNVAPIASLERWWQVKFNPRTYQNGNLFAR
jgi:RHS repeat-associated protein